MDKAALQRRVGQTNANAKGPMMSSKVVWVWGAVFMLIGAGPSRGAEAPEPPPAEAAAGHAQDEAVYFLTDIMPMLDRLGCNATACHGSAAGKGGLRFSMFGASPRDDYLALTREAPGRRINFVEPEKSLLLRDVIDSVVRKTKNEDREAARRSDDYQRALRWILSGAPYAPEGEAELVSLRVAPEELTLKPGESSRLVVTAVYGDGTEHDVTRGAAFASNDAEVAAVGIDGMVSAKGFGETAVVVGYRRKFAAVRTLVPRKLEGPFPELPVRNRVDELVLAKLRTLGIPPSEPCTDEVFLRRVYLDLTGTLPTVEQARAFLDDKAADKRARLIDQLLDSREFADYWALKWGDLLRIKSEFPSNLWPNAVQAYHHWIRACIADNLPYDEFARQLLTASGSNFRNPPVNYFRAFQRRDPRSIAEATALVFMGARIGCARCHAHPQESWDLEDDLGLAAFFGRLGYKSTQEWKEEIVYFDPKRSLRHPRTRELVSPRVPGGEPLKTGPEEDPRVRFAQWLTSPDNPWFARNIVNRVWFWLLGRGIVHEPDDLRSTNPPENPELLDFLAQELVSHDYDLKHIYRLILNSQVYQLSSRTNEQNAHDRAHFSHYLPKRLGAETLLDAIGQVTETSETFTSRIPEPFIRTPKDFRAIHLADGSIGVPFLELFGRPPRDSAYESDRDFDTSMRQILHLLNSSHVQGKINTSPRLRRFFQEKVGDEQIIEELYLSTLARRPTDEEKQRLTEYLSAHQSSRTQAVQDLVWAIFNTKEFLFNH